MNECRGLRKQQEVLRNADAGKGTCRVAHSTPSGSFLPVLPYLLGHGSTKPHKRVKRVRFLKLIVVCVCVWGGVPHVRRSPFSPSVPSWTLTPPPSAVVTVTISLSHLVLLPLKGTSDPVRPLVSGSPPFPLRARPAHFHGPSFASLLRPDLVEGQEGRGQSWPRGAPTGESATDLPSRPRTVPTPRGSPLCVVSLPSWRVSGSQHTRRHRLGNDSQTLHPSRVRREEWPRSHGPAGPHTRGSGQLLRVFSQFFELEGESVQKPIRVSQVVRGVTDHFREPRPTSAQARSGHVAFRGHLNPEIPTVRTVDMRGCCCRGAVLCIAILGSIPGRDYCVPVTPP